MRMRERVHDVDARRRPSYAPFTFKRVGAMDDALLACSVGDIAWLKRCLSSDFNPSTANKEVFTGRMRRKYKLATERSQGLNCLHLASKNGHLDCLRHLLNNCSIGVDETAASSDCTALHLSISTKSSLRSLQCMKLLLERGADQNKCVNVVRLRCRNQ